MVYLTLKATYDAEGYLHVANGPSIKLHQKHDWIPNHTEGYFLVRQVDTHTSEYKIINVVVTVKGFS